MSERNEDPITVTARARLEREFQELVAKGKVIDLLEPLANDQRLRVLAMVAVGHGLIDPRRVLALLKKPSDD